MTANFSKAKSMGGACGQALMIFCTMASIRMTEDTVRHMQRARDECLRAHVHGFKRCTFTHIFVKANERFCVLCGRQRARSVLGCDDTGRCAFITISSVWLHVCVRH